MTSTIATLGGLMQSTSNCVTIYPYQGSSTIGPLSCGCYGWCSCRTGWWYSYAPAEPTNCIGKAHVFECEHVNACKCGAIKRVMPRAKKRG